MEFNIKFNLSGEQLLNKYGEEFIYNYYRNNGEAFKFNKSNLCEFHIEKTPSMRFYRKGGSLSFKCFGCGKGGDVFNYVSYKLEIDSHNDVINKINEDLEGKVFTKKNTFIDTVSNTVDIITTKRNWEYYDYLYWKSFYISLENCSLFDIEPVYEVFINKEGNIKQVFTNVKNNPVYSININNRNKIYRPLANKNSKWLQNCNRFDVLGYKQLPDKGDILIITSSLKDVIVLYNLGYSAVSSISETTLIPDNIMNEFFKRFKEIIVFLDDDNAGRSFSKTYEKLYNLKTIFTNSNEKDISDFIKKYGIVETKELINNLLNNE